jgi:3-phosphoshikimate 1-carboxyvinyltransferase
MERIADPLRRMGAEVRTTDGHPPVSVVGGGLRGIVYRLPTPSAQVKSTVLLAGLGAEGETAVVESVQTRDHTERALEALGAPLRRSGTVVRVGPFQHSGFSAAVPGDPSSAAFLVAAAGLTASRLRIDDVGLNPTRLHFLEVMSRMGIRTRTTIDRVEMGEPVGSIEVLGCEGVVPVRVTPSELPLVIDEVPVLAAVAAHASSDSWFLGAGELRVKESDRLTAVAGGIRALGGHAADEGADLVVAGGGLRGGRADAAGDHRMAMAFAVAALAADAPCRVDGMEVADVSFPGFTEALIRLGARIEAAS